MAIKIIAKSKLKELPFLSFWYFSLFLPLAATALVLTIKSFLPPVVPLFYGQAEGERIIAPMLGLLIIPATSLFITAINTILSLFSKDIFLKKTLILGAFFISILLSISLVKIIFLVGFF